MDFQERFKGRTSTIGKDGFEGLIFSPATPVKRDFTPSHSLSRSCIMIEDHTPISRSNIALSPSSKKNTFTHSSSLVLNNESQSPKAFPFTPANQSHSPKMTPKQPVSPQLPFLSPKNAGMTPSHSKPNSLVELFPQKEKAFRLRNNSLKEIKRHPSLSIIRPMNSYIETVPSPTLEPNNNTPSLPGVFLLKNRTRSLVRIGTDIAQDTNINVNQLHKKNFEVLSQQNKERQIAKETGKDLSSPKYGQKYTFKNEESSILRNSRIIDSRQAQLMSPIQSRQEPGSPGKMSRANNKSIVEEDIARGMLYFVKPEGKKSIYSGSQMSFLNKMKAKMTDSMDLSGVQGRNDESTRLYSNGRGDNMSMSLSMIQMSQMLDGSSRVFNPNSVANLYVEKNRSEDLHNVIRPKRISSKI